jgi:hypothetical protein
MVHVMGTQTQIQTHTNYEQAHSSHSLVRGPRVSPSPEASRTHHSHGKGVDNDRSGVRRFSAVLPGRGARVHVARGLVAEPPRKNLRSAKLRTRGDDCRCTRGAEDDEAFSHQNSPRRGPREPPQPDSSCSSSLCHAAPGTAVELVACAAPSSALMALRLVAAIDLSTARSSGNSRHVHATPPPQSTTPNQMAALTERLFAKIGERKLLITDPRRAIVSRRPGACEGRVRGV